MSEHLNVFHLWINYFINLVYRWPSNHIYVTPEYIACLFNAAKDAKRNAKDAERNAKENAFPEKGNTCLYCFSL